MKQLHLPVSKWRAQLSSSLLESLLNFINLRVPPQREHHHSTEAIRSNRARNPIPSPSPLPDGSGRCGDCVVGNPWARWARIEPQSGS